MFTKGEWKARKLLVDRHCIIKREAWEISTPEYDVATFIEASAPIRKEADAHLIAAAPDLYQALKEMLLYFRERDIAPLYTWRDAIAKAEGK